MSRFLGYAILPLIGSIVWAGFLLGLLIAWGATGAPRYKQGEATIVYISDVGAKYKPVFIAATCSTAFFFLSTLAVDRILRARHRLPEVVRRREEAFSLISIFFAVVGSAALILLSIFDAFNHNHLHWSFTLIFIVGIALSAIFTILEVRYLKKDHPYFRHLSRSHMAKATLVTIAIILAIAMVGMMASCSSVFTGNTNSSKCNAIDSASAVCEWVVSFIFAGYIATFILDLRPAVETSKGFMKRKGLVPPSDPGSYAQRAEMVQAI